MNLYLHCLSVAVTAFGLETGSQEPVAEKHYMLLFASQAEPVVPRTSHSWATFVKARGTGDDVASWQLESLTISWLPVGGVVMPRVARERGENLDLPTTLAWARRQRATLWLWEPVEIDRELYDLAQRQKARLESGALMYHMLNGGLRPGNAHNCIHALSDLAPGPRLLTGTAYGEAASVQIGGHLRRWIVNSEQAHDWLIERLDLKEQNLNRRSW